MLLTKNVGMKPKYFSYVGSYEGAIQVNEKWVRVKNLNHINKTGFDRHQGPPTKQIEAALKQKVVLNAADLYPHLIVKKVAKPV